MIEQRLKEKYDEFLLSNKWVDLPQREHRPEDAQYIWASALGHCYRENAHNRLDLPETFPLTFDERLSKNHLMRQGVMDAIPLQQTLVWCGWSTKEDIEFQVESADWRIRGRVDALFTLDGQRQGIEFKRRDPFGGDDIPFPKLSDCYQAMAYSAILNIPFHIVALNRYFLNLWSLVPSGRGFVVEGRVPWVDKYNDPEYLNHDRLREEIALHRKWLDNPTQPGIPFPDFMNHDRGWLCWKAVKKAKKQTEKQVAADGTFKRNCPFFCHCADAGPYNYRIESDGTKVPLFPAPF